MSSLSPLLVFGLGFWGWVRPFIYLNSRRRRRARRVLLNFADRSSPFPKHFQSKRFLPLFFSRSLFYEIPFFLEEPVRGSNY